MSRLKQRKTNTLCHINSYSNLSQCNAIQTAHLTNSEYTDKIKIADCELQILRAESLIQDKALQVTQRNIFANFLQQLQVKYSKLRQKKDELRSEINKDAYVKLQKEGKKRFTLSIINDIRGFKADRSRQS